MSVRKRPPRYRKDGSLAPSVWQADFALNGKRVVKQFPTQREAKVYERQSKAAADKGAFTAPRRDGKTVADAANLYLERCKAEEQGGELRRQTVEYYGDLIRLHILPRLVEIRAKGKPLKVPLGDVKLGHLTRPIVEQWRLGLVGTGKRVTAVHTLVQLKLILNNAVRLGLVEYNVALPVKIKQKAPSRKVAGRDFPNAKEALMLIQEVEGHLRPIVITLLSTGMRQGELRALAWDHIDFKHRMIRVEHSINRFRERGPTKTESGMRSIPITDSLAQALWDWKNIYPQGLLDADGRPIRFYIPEHRVLAIAEFLKEKPGLSDKEAAKLFDVCHMLIRRVRKAMPLLQSGQSPLVFPNTESGSRDGSSIWRQFRALQSNLGMTADGTATGKPKYTVHDLRHFRTSFELHNGHPLADLAQTLGHKDPSMIFRVYGHPLGDLGELTEEEISRLGLLFSPRVQQK
jgi:integrase